MGLRGSKRGSKRSLPRTKSKAEMLEPAKRKSKSLFVYSIEHTTRIYGMAL